MASKTFKRSLIFGWIGSKARLTAMLAKRGYPWHRRHLSLFGGSGAEILNKPPAAEEIYNDLNPDLCALMQIITDSVRCRQLIARAERGIKGKPSTSQQIEAAWRWLLDHRRAYAQSYSDKLKWLPGDDRSPESLPGHIRDFAIRFGKVKVECLDALEALQRYNRSDTLLTADPPYPGVGVSAYTRNLPRFTEAKHHALVKALRAWKGSALVFGLSDCPIYDKGLHDWAKETWVSYGLDKQSPTEEAVWSNFELA